MPEATGIKAMKCKLEQPNMNLLITGKPGSGKTTLIRKIISESNRIWGGFYTQEIREHHQRIGFKIISLSGQTGVLAHVDSQGEYRIGKYYINMHDLETIGVDAVEQALQRRQPIVIDEIGKMELYSEKFKSILLCALNSPLIVLGTITLAAIPFVSQIKRRPDVMLFELTPENRGILTTTILQLLHERN